MKLWLAAVAALGALLLTPVSAVAQARVNFPARTCDVTTYGARGTRVFPDTATFQRAIDDCTRQGGGTVHVPRGEYLIGPSLPQIRHPAPPRALFGAGRDRRAGAVQGDGGDARLFHERRLDRAHQHRGR